MRELLERVVVVVAVVRLLGGCVIDTLKDCGGGGESSLYARELVFEWATKRNRCAR